MATSLPQEAFSNLFRGKTSLTIEDGKETAVHHNLSKNKIKEINESVDNEKTSSKTEEIHCIHPRGCFNKID